VPTQQEPSFRYIPGFALLITAGAVVFLYGFYLILRVPDVVSPIEIITIVLAVVVNGYLWPLAWFLWKENWRFAVRPDVLVAEHAVCSTHVEIPWGSIVRIRRRRVWGEGRLRFIVIETVDGKKIALLNLLMGYERFMEELSARAANCQEVSSEWRWRW